MTKDKAYMEARVEQIEEVDLNAKDDALYEALVRNTLLLFEEYAAISPKMPPDFITKVLNERSLGKLSDLIASNLVLNLEDKQKILSTTAADMRLEALNVILDREIEVLSLEQEIGMRVRDQLDKNQRDYYLREQIRVLQT